MGGAADHARSDAFTESLDKSPFGLDVPDGPRGAGRQAAPFGDVVATRGGRRRHPAQQRARCAGGLAGLEPGAHSPWRSRAKLGAFFPLTSLEVGYDQVGWNPVRTISSSAINSWIAQEVRPIGIEFTEQWRGALLDVPHTFTLRMARVRWQRSGWHRDRVARLGSFRPRHRPVPETAPAGSARVSADGPIAVQTRNVHVFRELDHRPGWYGALGYAYEGVLDVEVMHYDNRADPLR